MGLLELCLLPLLSPQDPAATIPIQTDQAPTVVTAAAATAPAAAEPPHADPVDVAALQRLERSERLDFELLDRLLGHQNPAVVLRAVWLLGQKPTGEALPRLLQLAQGSPSAESRVQAMAALLRLGPATALTVAIAGLDDESPCVRTLAAQLLGRLQAPAAERALLALLRRPASPSATDAIAALLALHDLKAQSQLLPAAEAIAASGTEGLGQALTFYFQGVSPTLPERAETPLLLSVLGHREPMLRRYALGRLIQLAPPDATAALEARLAQETAELRPLVEIALTRCRPPVAPIVAPETAAAANGMLVSLQQRWAQLNDGQLWLVYGLSGGFLLVGIGLLGVLARRRRIDAATPSSIEDMVAPSHEHPETEQGLAIADDVNVLADDLEAASAAVTAVDLVEGDEASISATDWSTASSEDTAAWEASSQADEHTGDAEETSGDAEAALAAEASGTAQDYRHAR
jgi:HEAT repeat protein